MFLKHLITMGGFDLVHHWHGIDMLVVLEAALLALLCCLTLAAIGKWVKRSRRLTIVSLVGALSFATAAYAANTALSALSSSGAIAGGNLFYVVQTVGVGGVKATAAQIATYINSLFSGDATVASGGAVTLATVNSNVGSFGSATQCVSLTTNAKGLITAASAVTCTPAVGSITGFGTGVGTALAINIGSAGAPVLFNGAGGTPSAITLTNGTNLPLAAITGFGANVATFLAAPSSANLLAALTTKTGTGNAVFGTAPTISSLNATTALTLAFLTGSTQCLQVNTSGVVSGTGSACGAGGGGVSSIAGNTGAFTLNVTSGITNSTNDIVCSQGSASQFGCVKADGTTLTAAAGVISAVPATAAPSVQTGANYAFVTGDRVKVTYLSNASAQTPTIAQAGTTGFEVGKFWQVCNINTGIQTITPATSTIGGAASYALLGGTAPAPKCVTIISDGTNYTLFPAGTTQTIASGTSALGTGAISSATCATVVTTSATGVATTDVVSASFNGDPTAVTGYVPLTAGMLTIIGYPTANNVNFKVCNNTSSSITPGAITLNWRVVR